MSTPALADRWNALWRPAAVPPPRPSRWAWAADAVLAFLLALGTVNGTLNASGHAGHPGSADVPAPPVPPVAPFGMVTETVPAWYLVPAVLTALPLVARRRYPLAAFWTVGVAALLYHLGTAFDPTFTFASCVVAAYSAAMYSPYRRLATVSAVAVAALVVADHQSRVPVLRPGLVALLALAPIGLAANAMHTWKQRVRELEAEREATARLAVERERARIAQELHDVVTHNVGVMVVQAGAARLVMREAPERAEAALLAVESGGRAAMTELRHVMDLLTPHGDRPDIVGLAPRPGLGQVATLADRVRDTGVPVELSVTGTPTALTDGMDLAAYRVVQESLTNTVKHAGGARVTVSIEHAPGTLRVEVTDTGGDPVPASFAGDGRGLIGLRQRLAVYGGTLEAGPRAGGGYRVCAVFPLEGR